MKRQLSKLLNSPIAAAIITHAVAAMSGAIAVIIITGPDPTPTVILANDGLVITAGDEYFIVHAKPHVNMGWGAAEWSDGWSRVRHLLDPRIIFRLDHATDYAELRKAVPDTLVHPTPDTLGER